MVALVERSLQRLSAGEPALTASWPVPPEGLRARPIDYAVRVHYASEVADRLAQIDDVISAGEDPFEAVQALYRHVHTMKGAASAVGDEPMTWFCHGLEEKIRSSDSPEAARAATHEVARWRSTLGALLDEPDAALRRLGARRPPSELPRTSWPDEAAVTIRVPAVDVDRLLERIDAIDQARERIGSRAVRGREAAVSLRELSATLADALRSIGPTRKWGPPASALSAVSDVARALASFSENLDLASTRLRATEQLLRDSVADARSQLLTMRQTTVGRIFARLTTAIESEARRTGRAVIVRTRGVEETVDRRIAEQLMEPCLQLVRNAVAHGIEPASVRVAQGKPQSGTIALAAHKIGNRLRVTITDDGAGVNVREVRERAAAAGLVTPAIAQAVDDDTLLSLLFSPGFSTRESTDLLAGRGIGLDIARAGAARVGGAVRLSSSAGQGVTAELDVPIESGLVTMLWVAAGGVELAVPAANVHRVEKYSRGEQPHVPHLLACLGVAESRESPFGVDLRLNPDDAAEPPAWVGVDVVGKMEGVLFRPIGPLIADMGRFSGAIVRGDGLVRLAIDVWAVAPRARAMSAAKR